MLLVADTSPLISLILINRVAVLINLFPDFILPNAVWDELNAHNRILSNLTQLNLISSHVRTVDASSIEWNYDIDIGEMEAIALYKQLHADSLLIDDKVARNYAESIGINCIGTLTLLYLAKKQNLIPLLKPEFDALRTNKRFYSEILFNYFLKMAEE